MTKHKLKPKFGCKLCGTTMGKAGICVPCSRAMSGVTMTLHKIGIAEDHPLWTEYFSAVFAQLGDRQKTLRSVCGDMVSFHALAALEYDEAHRGKREIAYYIRHMAQDDMIRAFHYADTGKMPTESEMNAIKLKAQIEEENLKKIVARNGN